MMPVSLVVNSTTAVRLKMLYIEFMDKLMDELRKHFLSSETKQNIIESCDDEYAHEHDAQPCKLRDAHIIPLLSTASKSDHLKDKYQFITLMPKR